MSTVAHDYDEALLASAPEIDKKQRQEGYSTDLLNQPDKHRSTAASPGADAASPSTSNRDIERGAPPRSRTGSTTGAATPAPAALAPSPLKPTKSRPFYKTKKGLLIIAAVLAAIIIAAVVGGVVGSRNSKKDPAPAAPAQTTTQQSGADDNSQGGGQQGSGAGGDQQNVGDSAAATATGQSSGTSSPPFPGLPTGPAGAVEQQPSVSGPPPVGRRMLVRRRVVADLD